MASTTSSTTTTRIAIVGGGIGGLTLARILQLRKVPNISLTLFESDSAESERGSFGGSLDLKQQSGQRAMREAGLYEGFLELCRPAGGQTCIMDHMGTVHLQVEGREDDLSNPEIDRAQLRGLILGSLEPGTVRWGHKATAVSRDAATGKYAIEFASGYRENDVDVVVGADGAWSCVRPLVWPGVAPIYSGVTFVETKANIRDHPKLAARIGGGSLVVMGEGKCVMAQMSANDVLTVYTALRVPEDWARTSAVALAATEQEKLALLVEEFAGWDETALEFIRVGHNPIMRPIHALPCDSEPRTKIDNIVLLGDAAHLMSPFAGAGVNMALADAADLGEVLATGKSLAEYEEMMRERGNRVGKMSAANLEMFFAEDAAKKVTEFFNTKK